MAIRDWPAQERPREKLLARGPAALSDAELLAVFLRTGAPGVSALDLARSVITAFGGLRALLTAQARDVCAIRGLGAAKHAQLQAALEIGRRVLAERLWREGPLAAPQEAAEYLVARLRDQREEVFCCLYLDTRHFVIGFEELFRGSISGASVHPRVLVRRVLEHNAAAVIVAHNHPSGVAEPSRADETLTARLKDALALVDTRLLDHLVIGDGEWVSFSERGLL